MRREIKFRGKGIDDGEWLYGDLLRRYGITEIYQSSRTTPIIPETVGQFTGLKDKNGVEIYEGDIIEHHRDGLCIVSYGIQNVDAFEGIGFNLWDFYGEYSDIGKAIRLQSSVEIIGNIHDNHKSIETI